MSPLNERHFDPAYGTCRPLVSQDQKFLCIPRLKTPDSAQADLIDLYSVGDDFWTRKDQITTSDQDFRCSLEISENVSIQTIRFGAENRYLGVLCIRQLLIFDVSQTEFEEWYD